ncbi:MAG: Abi family protein [Oscillospiraceae bacterium]|nr:Abi family protein [Oscillospiraceae bacterium]
MSKSAFSERDIGVKSPATISGQLRILNNRGLVIEDLPAARRTLETVNYYRLVHYFAVFLDEMGEYYEEGTRFTDGVRLYDFDRKLRSIILVSLEEVEVAARAAISNYHSVKYGATGYLNADSFDRRHNHKGFLHKTQHMITKNADLTFVRHHNNKYGGSFPLWVLMEMFSFGTLAVFYGDLKVNDKKEIADYYYGHDYRNVENWLENLAILRNRCAHYNRIYGNPLPGNIRGGESQTTSSVFEHMLALKSLHKGNTLYETSWGQAFAEDMAKLFADYADIAEPSALGFPDDWSGYFATQAE